MYIKLEHKDNDTLYSEYAQLCSIIPNLELIPVNMPFGATGCSVTKRGIEQKIVVTSHKGRIAVLTICVFTGGVYADVLNQIVASITRITTH